MRLVAIFVMHLIFNLSSIVFLFTVYVSNKNWQKMKKMGKFEQMCQNDIVRVTIILTNVVGSTVMSIWQSYPMFVNSLCLNVVTKVFLFITSLSPQRRKLQPKFNLPLGFESKRLQIFWRKYSKSKKYCIIIKNKIKNNSRRKLFNNLTIPAQSISLRIKIKLKSL